MEKGSELASKLMRVDDIHPLIKDTLIMQQQDIFFLRKQLIEQAQTISTLIDNFAGLVNANDAMLRQYKQVIDKNGSALKKDLENAWDFIRNYNVFLN